MKKIILLILIFPSFVFSFYIEGPFVANIKERSALIWWKGIGGKLFIDGKVYEKKKEPFEIKIKGLSAGRSYRYYVIFENGERRPEKGYYTFHTEPEGEFRFAVAADSRGPLSFIPIRKSILKEIFQDAKKRKVEFFCFLGDLVFGYASSEKKLRNQLREWKKTVAFFMHEIPVYTTMGNHDTVFHKVKDKAGYYFLDGEKKNGRIVFSEDVFSEEFVNPAESFPEKESAEAPSYRETAYSFDFGNSHFLFLNTDYWIACSEGYEGRRFYEKGNPSAGRIMDRQIEWIEKDLKDARKRGIKHIFVFGHRPIFPITEKQKLSEDLRSDLEKRRKRIWDIFSRYKVTCAFFGHEHNYSRTLIKGVWQIVTGGAGAPLHSCSLRKEISDKVKKCKMIFHYCLVTVKKDRVILDVIGIKEKKIIDHAEF